MASRFSTYKPLERCLSPIMVEKNGVVYRVPCGKCSACLLDRANSWSMRLVNEIDSQPYTIFATFTYNNFYLPKLDYDGKTFVYFSNHSSNIRYDGTKDVCRKDNICISYPSKLSLPKIQNFDGSTSLVAYSSKLDFQLYLKLLRKDLYEKFGQYGLIRYYAISEYGPTTFRPHIHALFFCSEPEVAEYLLSCALYKNWSMCDKTLFDEYTKIADTGSAGYVTNYVTGVNNLPSFFRNEEIRPFRLASKAPSIGFYQYDKKKVLEEICGGVIEYTKSVSRLSSEYVLRYPPRYCRSFLPKCREFGILSYQRLRYIYGFIYRNVIKRRFSFDTVCRFLREKWFPADYQAARKMYDAYLILGYDPDTYLYVLDLYYYKADMFALKNFYEWQEQHHESVVDIMCSYVNFSERCLTYLHSDHRQRFTLDLFCKSFNVDAFEFCNNISKSDLIFNNPERDSYSLECDDIIDACVKLPKFYEANGLSPHSV